MVNVPFRDQTAGIPYQWSETIGADDGALVTGNEPALLTVDQVVAPGQTLAALTVVGFDANGRIVPATDAVKAVGVLVVAVTTAAGETVGAPVYRAGCLNPDRLVWDGSLSTEAERINAFEGAPSPTAIVLRRPKSAQVV